jgi:hypothetical protein
MVEITKLELSLNELQLLLIALDSLHKQLHNKSTRGDALLQIHDAEKFFNFDFDIVTVIQSLPKFLDDVIAVQIDKTYDAYFQLADEHGLLKPLAPEDSRYSVKEMIEFLDVDLKTLPEVI